MSWPGFHVSHCTGDEGSTDVSDVLGAPIKGTGFLREVQCFYEKTGC